MGHHRRRPSWVFASSPAPPAPSPGCTTASFALQPSSTQVLGDEKRQQSCPRDPTHQSFCKGQQPRWPATRQQRIDGSFHAQAPFFLFSRWPLDVYASAPSHHFLALKAASVIGEIACFVLVQPRSPALCSGGHENMKKCESAPADWCAVAAAI